MGVFHINTGYTDDLAVAPGAKDGKIYKAIQLTSISVFVIAFAILILEMFRLLRLGTTANGTIFSVVVACFGGMTALPWVRIFESLKDKRYKITAIAFFGLITVCTVLWIVCVWQIIAIVKSVKTYDTDESFKKLVRSLNVIRASLIVSLQFMMASGIVMNVIKYRKTLLPYQIMAGVSTLYVDFYFTLLLTAFTLTEHKFKINPSATILTNKWLLPLLIVFCMLAIFPALVFRRADRRRLLAAKKDDTVGLAKNNSQPQKSTPSDNEPIVADNDGSDSAEERLTKIKSLLDKNLITQEEYDAKRAEILSRI